MDDPTLDSQSRELANILAALAKHMTEGVVAAGIAFVTVAGYAGLVLFEASYCRQFGIPLRLIEVRLGGAILLGVAAVVPAVYALLVYVHCCDAGQRRVGIVFVIVLLTSILLAILLWNPAPPMLLILFSMFLWYIIKSPEDREPSQPWRIRLTSFGAFTWIFGGLLVAAALAYAAGQSCARRTVDYLTNESGTLFLAAAYGEHLVFCGYEPGNYEEGAPPKLTGEVVVRSANADGSEKLVWKRLGSFKPWFLTERE
jgi:hypothetical protein